MTLSVPITSATTFIGDQWRVILYLDDCQIKTVEGAGGKTCRDTDKYSLPTNTTGRTVRVRFRASPATECTGIMLDYKGMEGNLRR